MSETLKLKPCPLCGGEPTVDSSFKRKRIRCLDCGAANRWLPQVMDCPTPPEVRRAADWNARVDASERHADGEYIGHLQARVEELEKRLADCVVWMETREKMVPGMSRVCDMARAALTPSEQDKGA